MGWARGLRRAGGWRAGQILVEDNGRASTPKSESVCRSFIARRRRDRASGGTAFGLAIRAGDRRGSGGRVAAKGAARGANASSWSSPGFAKRGGYGVLRRTDYDKSVTAHF